MTRKGFPTRPARLLTTLTLLLLLAVPLMPRFAQAAAFDALLQRELQARHERERQLAPRFSPGVDAALEVTEQPRGDGVCFPLQTIEIRGATVLPPGAVARFTALPDDGCMTAAALTSRVHQINQWYMQRGFVTSRAALPAQDLGTGRLLIEVIEGRIEAFTATSAVLSPALLRQVFPRRDNALLNLRDLEQGLQNLNRLNSRSATLELVPGSMPGYSRVALTAAVETPWYFRAGIDNHGQARSGRYQASALMARDNVLGRAGFAYAWLQSDIGARGDDARSQTLQLHYDVPVGYYAIDVDLFQFRYSSAVSGLAQPLNNHGRVRQYSIGVQRVLHRDARAITRAGVTWRRRERQNDIADVRLHTSSFEYRVGGLFVEHERYLRRAYLNLGIGIDRGLDGTKLHADDRRYRFQRHWLELRVNGDVKALPGVYWRQQFYAQGATGPLYSAEQITIGGQHTVRGFDAGNLSGVRGGWWRQHLSATPPATELPWMADRVSIGFDLGRVASPQSGWRSLRGAGIEARWRWRDLSLVMSYSRAINPPAQLDDGAVLRFALQFAPG